MAAAFCSRPVRATAILIDLYAQAAFPYYATSSLYAEIYRLLPNDTDLTLFIKQGFTSFNFAFSDNVADYHTPLDRRDNLSKLHIAGAGRQHARRRSQARADRITPSLAATDDVYLDIFGAVVAADAEELGAAARDLSVVLMHDRCVRTATEASRAGTGCCAILMPPALLIAVRCRWACCCIRWPWRFPGNPIRPTPIRSPCVKDLAFGVVAAALLVARMTIATCRDAESCGCGLRCLAS